MTTIGAARILPVWERSGDGRRRGECGLRQRLSFPRDKLRFVNRAGKGSQLPLFGLGDGDEPAAVGEAVPAAGTVISDVLVVPFELARAELLAALVGSAKGADPLAPVTVVVPSNFAGLQLRRSLAAEGDGLVNVRFLVLPRLAELLGAPLLTAEGRRPLTPWLQYAAIRSALASHDGALAAVADHPSTPKALATTFRDLRQAPGGVVEELLRRGGGAREIAAVYRRFRELTLAMYDAEDLADAAARAVATENGALRDIGKVIVFLPRTLSPAAVELVEALRAKGRASLVLGATGEEAVDRPTGDLLVRLGRAEMQRLLRRDGDDEDSTAETRIAIGVDMEEEARIIVRLVAAEMRDDVPLSRIGVLHSLPEYGALLREQFRSAGIPCNGAAGRTLAQSAAGRSLLGVYGLADGGTEAFRREEVMRWLTQAPILEPGDRRRHAPSALWDAISRKAGIVRGAEQWERRIATWLARSPRNGGAFPWQQPYGERLSAFMSGLLADLALLERGASAGEHAKQALRLMDRYLGDEADVANWRSGGETGEARDAELEAYRAIRRLLEEIGRTEGAGGALDFLAGLDPQAARAAFVEALTVLLERPGASEGRFGEGVFIGPVSAGAGMHFDLVFLAGMAEGAMPPTNREDPLLPDEARDEAQMASRQSRRNEARRDFLAALASSKRRVLSYARSAARQQGTRLPSRWLVEVAEALSGLRFSGEELERLRPSEHPWLIAPASFESALGDVTVEPGSAQEYELRSLLRSDTPASRHYLAAEESFADALRVAASRLPGWLVREPSPGGALDWDGRIAADERIAPWIGTPEREPATVSPTSLENYAECPYRFFLKHVLRIEEMSNPEEMLKLDAAERGNIIHDTLERFFTEAGPREPDQEWTERERRRLQELADERFAETERAGLAGPELMWGSEKARIRRELNLFLTNDDEVRRETGARFQNAEKGFGRKTDDADQPWPPARVDLGAGRRLSLSGQVDRVDSTADGYAVYDYKSGGTYAFREIESEKAADPLVRGKKLQLPVYALAVRQSVEGAESARIEAKYWFVNEQEGFRQIGYALDEAHERRFVEVLNVITASVEAGQFPQTPSKKSGDQNSTPSNCKYCAFDRLCPSADRRERWEQTLARPELAALAALIEGTDGEDEEQSDE